jgi:integrase
MPKLRKALGIIRKKGDLCWYYLCYSPTGKHSYRSTGIVAEGKGKTPPQDVVDAVLKLRQQDQQPRDERTEKWTVFQLRDAWIKKLEHLAEPLANETLRSYKGNINLVCGTPEKPMLGLRRLETLRAEDFEWYQKQRQEEGLGGRTINYHLFCLQMALIAFAPDLWKRHFVLKYHKVSQKDSTKRRALTEAQLTELVKTANGKERWRETLWVAIIAADMMQRPCEILGLRLKYIHFPHPLLHWEPPLSPDARPTMEIERDTTKTDAGERELPLTRRAQWALKNLLDAAARKGCHLPEHFLLPTKLSKHTKQFACGNNCECKGKGCDRGTPDPLYERRLEGGYEQTIQQSNWNTSWRSIRTKAGLPWADFYHLRHTGATSLGEQEVPTAVASNFMGHSNTTITETYQKAIRMKALSKAAEAIDQTNPELNKILGLLTAQPAQKEG